VQSAFGIVIFSVVAISGLIAIGTFIFGGAPPHSTIGGNAFTPSVNDPGVESAEMRELLDAPKDKGVDGEVRGEVEAIVAARQARRRRKGKPEGDFQAEVDELIRSIADG
jgi:hypothetical protein